MNENEAIGVTGIGLVTPLGLSGSEAWERCRDGKSGIAACHRFDTAGHVCQSAAVVRDYQLRNLRAPKNQKFMNPGVRHLIQAAQDALACASVQIGSIDPGRVAVHAGSGHVGPEPNEFFRAFGVARHSDGAVDWDQLGGRAARLVDPYFPLRTLSNSGVALLAMEIGARGPSNNFVQSDVASALALNASCQDLREARCDLAIAGAFDFLVTPAVYLIFETQGMLSSKPPEEAFRPFDRDGDGLVLGEGAAAVVLERVSDARRRGAPILAEIAGFGSATSASDSIEPFATPHSVAAALSAAASQDQPDFVAASGFGIPAIDRAEAAVLSEVVGNQVPVTAFKSLTGYLGAATALVEIILGILALRNGLIPPVARHCRKAEGIDLNIVSSTAIPLPAGRLASALFLSNSWTGQSAAVYVRQPPE
jgi:3-oxoacyl-[acyl-carrier-protein] synthase II